MLQNGGEARRGSHRLDGARNLDGYCGFSRASNQHCRSDKRQRRQHKRHCGDHCLVRILTARHGAGHQATHIVAAIQVRIGVRRSSFPVMMLGNIAVIPGAAGHGVARPHRTRQRSIQQPNGQQAEACGENSAVALGRSVQALLGTKPTPIL